MLKNLKRDREELVVDVPNGHVAHKSAVQLGNVTDENGIVSGDINNHHT